MNNHILFIYYPYLFIDNVGLLSLCINFLLSMITFYFEHLKKFTDYHQ